ncbi:MULTISPECIES: TetR/AcrR family transcriptional regulator [Burkholderia]|uniref:HTH-type transcriptional regulator BetI n=1 Tax=Burkholderia aenigmatica TaxID=2015348 RepID=A0ABY6XRC7_9BURK|nr:MULTISPECIES: TetR/AcrR family transcriptional regulator [Burkholderia]VWC66979.1 HTH-type transcriptional regulator BetI [Burkholderia aenigmatica]VWC91307.1 HTH-type transcriptional regulator BetI [Burkholderia aenigmatica]
MTQPTKRQRGRPPRAEEEARRELLQSAMDVLLESGYEGATMEAIAKRAAVAKKTAYRYAANRQELIGLAVRQWTEEYAPSMQTDPQDAGDVAQALRAILENICTHVLSETAVSLFRLLTTEFPGKRELLDSYERNGIERGRMLLSGWLERQSRKGLLHAPEPALLANAILAVAVAEPLRQIALGVMRPLPEGTVASHLDACMKVLSLLIVQPSSREL